jgi:succinyl-CoA synthetase beta subunit
MFGMQLVTHQTGPEGLPVTRVYVEEGTDIARELYLSCLVDRATSRIAFIGSTEGGMDIEEVARATPEKVFTMTVDPATGLLPHHVRRLAKALKLDGAEAKQLNGMLAGLYRAFAESDMSLLEINPLVVTGDGQLICLDAKVNFDSNALYRHRDIAELRDETQEDEKEIEASKYDLSYIALDGEIGCMVNGAGLAMATMDMTKLFGGSPANFLDIGGGAKADKVAAALRIILADPNVKAVLFNIFGGITRCDEVAMGILTALDEVKVDLPMVVRLVGTNEEEGRRLIDEANIPHMVSAATLADAAKKAVAATRNA